VRHILLLLLGAGAAVGAMLVLDSPTAASRSSTRVMTQRERDRVLLDNEELIRRLRLRITDLEAQLAARSGPEEAAAYPDDSPEKVGKLLQAAYSENNVDWLLQVIERLLMMGERGYPMLRTMIIDIIFKAKFQPAQSDFRFDQLYTAGKVFTKHERKFIGFLNFLLTDAQTNKLIKQGAVPVAAFYVGAKAPGSEELQQTLLQMFLAGGGGGLPAGMLGNFGKRVNIFAMAMSGDPEMINPLRDELRKEKSRKMQGEILGALAYLGDPKVLPDIKDRLDPNSKDDFRQEIRALARLGTEDAHSTAVDFVRAIPDSKRFYRHAAEYLRAGGGTQGVLLIRERVTARPDDPEIARAVGTLRRFPTSESHETLQLISTTAADEKIAKRAAKAAEDVGRRLRGELPEIAK